MLSSEAALKARIEQRKLIEHMLSEIESDLEMRGRENEFIKSLREQFDHRGSLTPNQTEALRKFYERI